MTRRFCLLVATFVVLFSPVAVLAGDAQTLAKELGPLWSCVSGSKAKFSITGTAEVPIGGKPQTVEFKFAPFDSESFFLSLKHAEYWVELYRNKDTTAFALPLHRVVFRGRGEVDAEDQLAPAGIIERLLSPGSLISAYAVIANQEDPTPIAGLLTTLLKLRFDEANKIWTTGKDLVRFEKEGRAIGLTIRNVKAHLEISDKPERVEPADDLKVVEIERRELERHLARGVRRAGEILAPSPLLTVRSPAEKQVAHGELRWVEGQHVVLLHGTPEQIGEAHGKLLKDEAQRCIDSVLYTFGTVQTIRTGRWFKQDLADAYARLAPHIPDDHKRETRALAKSLNMDEKLVESLNVFPELFHCSGFALFGKATVDGKLYHGRVLDYMTTIGLQDSAVTFIVAVDGKIPFANVGYAGCVGSVSGMNDKAISLGEMGGRGEGKWDGAPMATLMRRALEECSTLDDVMHLWKTSPRTCEYYYVFADGKTNRAVGVAATPETIEFVHPGQSDPRLGEGIEDAVVLSAGDRLARLRERVQERYGKIDAEAGQWLMCRPVAMESNLHNVLFVPADGILYVANADHQRPAAERPYVKLDFRALLKEMRK